MVTQNESYNPPGGGAPDVRAAAADLRARGFALCEPDRAAKSPTYPRWGTRSLEPDDFAPGDQLGIIGGPLSDGNRAGHALVVDLDSPDAVARADDHLPPTGMTDGRASRGRTGTISSRSARSRTGA